MNYEITLTVNQEGGSTDVDPVFRVAHPIIIVSPAMNISLFICVLLVVQIQSAPTFWLCAVSRRALRIGVVVHSYFNFGGFFIASLTTCTTESLLILFRLQ